MKLTSFSKAIHTLGVTALLSVLVGTTTQANTGSKAASQKAAITSLVAQAASTETIVEIAAGNPDFSTLVKAVQAAGLADTLSGQGPFTVFAPTNKAFAALPKGTLAKLLKPGNRNLLHKVLTYHVVSGDLMAKDLRSGRVATVEGRRVTVRVRHGKIRVNKSNVVKADIAAKNGVIHVIDRVLLPPNL
jgi:uncharacterized surface protein with fasciclin (FAS1) repeats